MIDFGMRHGNGIQAVLGREWWVQYFSSHFGRVYIRSLGGGTNIQNMLLSSGSDGFHFRSIRTRRRMQVINDVCPPLISMSAPRQDLQVKEDAVN